MTYFDPQFIAFLIGFVLALATVCVAVKVLDAADGWWGHRVYRKLEDQKEQPKTEDAVGDHDIGFHD